MAASRVTLTPIEGIPLIEAGDDLGAIIEKAIRTDGIAMADDDILVVAQKIVSKSEGRLVDLADVTPSPRAAELAATVGKDPRYIEVVLSEASEVLRYRDGLIIVEHRRGWVMANAGIDQSNVAQPEGSERVLLLPHDPDSSASALKLHLDKAFGADIGIVISDSFGRPWRNGVVGVALGAAGIPSLRNLVGEPDLFGRPLRITEVAVGDQIATAAALVMGETAAGCPVVHVRGLGFDDAPVAAAALIRPRERDLFR